MASATDDTALLFQKQGKLRALSGWKIEIAALSRRGSCQGCEVDPMCLSSPITSQLRGYFLQEKVFEFRAEEILLNSAKRFYKIPVRKRLRKHYF